MTYIDYTARVGLVRDEGKTVIHEFVLAFDDGATRHVALEIRASWYEGTGTATVWLMAGMGSELFQTELRGRPTTDDLTNLAVAMVARRYPMHHPLASELGF